MTIFIIDMVKSYKQLGFFIMTICLLQCRPHYTIHHDEKLYTLKGLEEKDSLSSIAQYLKPFRDSLNQTMNQIIGEAAGDFKKEKGGGSLGYLVIEAMNNELFQKRYSLWAGSTFRPPITITNPGGLRMSQISKGKITLEKAFELLPFENELTLIEVNGKTLRQWAILIQENGGWPNNARLTPDSVDELIVDHGVMNLESSEEKTIVKATRKSIVDDRMYRILTNDYIAGGGDNCYFLKDRPRIMTGITLRDALIHYVRSQEIVTPKN